MRNRELMRSSYIYAKHFYHAFMDKFVFIFPLTSSMSPFTKWVTNVGLHCTRYFHVISVFLSSKLYFILFFCLTHIYYIRWWTTLHSCEVWTFSPLPTFCFFFFINYYSSFSLLVCWLLYIHRTNYSLFQELVVVAYTRCVDGFYEMVLHFLSVSCCFWSTSWYLFFF